MQATIIMLVCLLLASISLIHVYWAFGGKWAVDSVIPMQDNKPLFKPGFFGSMIVAVLLVIAIGVILSFIELLKIPFLSQTLSYYGTIALGVVFLFRAIGDFKFLGFFKKIKDSNFAKWDTRIHSPLCAFLSALIFLILVMN